jgi:hypothetical protein
MRKSADPTKDIVSRALKASFPAHNPNIYLTRRRKDRGHNIEFVYSEKEGLERVHGEAIYQALADRLLVSKDGKTSKLTLDEIKERFTVKGVMRLGGARAVGEETDGTTHWRLTGWVRETQERVVLYLDTVKGGEDAHGMAKRLHPTALFASAMTTDTVVPPELKGKLLTAEEADELEPPGQATRRHRA